MLKITNYDIWNEGEKVGWIDGNHIRAHDDGRKLGYFSQDYVYNMMGQKIAYIDGDHLCSGKVRVSLEKVNAGVVGGLLSEICKCAIYILIGA